MKKHLLEEAANDVEMLTPNGFRVLHVRVSPDGFAHTFRVMQGEENTGPEFVVQIDPAAVRRLAQFTGSRHQPGGSFWASRAEDLLAAVLWAEGRLPPEGSLVVKDFSRIELDVALAWPANED